MAYEVGTDFEFEGVTYRVTKNTLVENAHVFAKKVVDGKTGRGRPTQFTNTPDGVLVKTNGKLGKSAPFVEAVVHNVEQSQTPPVENTGL